MEDVVESAKRDFQIKFVYLNKNDKRIWQY